MCAVSYQRLGDLDRSLADYSQAIDLKPKNPSHYFQRGLIFLVKNNIEKSALDFVKVMEIERKNEQVRQVILKSEELQKHPVLKKKLSEIK